MKQNLGLHAALVAYMASQPSEALIELDRIVLDLHAKFPALDRKQCANSMAYVAKKGGAKLGALRGTYVAPKRGNGQNPETVIIDNLLNAMAEAAPIITRWQRIQVALDSIK